MSKPEEIKHILDVIVKVARQFLTDEIGVNTSDERQYIQSSRDFCLKPFSVMMNVSGCFSLNITFSFDEPLIEQVYKVYCSELELDESEHFEHIDETAADMINIVIGNSTQSLAEDGTTVNISVPIVLKEASLTPENDVQVLISNLFTNYGDMMITAMPNMSE